MSNLNSSPKSAARKHELKYNESKYVKAMSIEEMRLSEHYRNWPEEQLRVIIDTVRTFTEIVYSAWSKSKRELQKETLIIPLNQHHRKAA